jgi:hypothetical protein
MRGLRKVAAALASAVVSVGSLAAAPPAQAATTAQFVGHRCNTYPLRSNTHENTAEAARRLSTAGPTAWCESDIWGLSNGTDGVWHDEVVGGAAARSSLPAGVTWSTPTRSLNAAQFDQIKTTGGSPTVTPVEMIQAAARYGIPRIVFEVRNALRNPNAIAAAASATGVSVVMYKIPAADCVVRVSGWTGLLGVKLSPTSPCTAQRFAEQGVDLVTQNIGSLVADNCRLVLAYRAAGLEIVAYGATASNYAQLERCGERRVVVNDAPLAASTW